MKLNGFRVMNFRSVNDSGPIEVRSRTAVVGRNESGKSNLLLALESLNPPGGIKPLSEVKDFPRSRGLDEFSDDIRVVETTWVLSDEERGSLTAVFPRARGVKIVTVSRDYKGRRQVRFSPLPALSVDRKLVAAEMETLTRSVQGSMQGKDAPTIAAMRSAMAILEENALAQDASALWAQQLQVASQAFRKAAQSAQFALTETAIAKLSALERHAREILEDDTAHASARESVVRTLPVFILVNEYPVLEGHQDIQEYLQRKGNGRETEADRNFTKLMKVAGLDPAQMSALLQQDHEKRQQLANRAGAVVTRRIRELWTDRTLKIRFNVDAQYFDTLVSDPTSIYDVEVNLDERSHGFKWFFSFYIAFAADTKGGSAEDAILLLDEPGLHLHAVAQRDLLQHFATDFDNQIVYTTHSPFMIPVDDLASIRTVNVDELEGTTVTNDPSGDQKTLFPLQTALGYDISQSLFVGARNLVVEGVTDFWYLSAVNDFLAAEGSGGLPEDVVLTPAGGAQKVSYMVALLSSQGLHVVVLLDEERDARRTAAEDLVKTKLIRDENVMFVTSGFDGGAPAEADVEDLLAPDVFDRLVRESYKKELRGKKLEPNHHVPRFVKRYEMAFENLGLEFNKTRPARLFLRKMAEEPEKLLVGGSRERFERLFLSIRERFRAQERRGVEAFR